ncbi:hypothetical protein G4G27_22290 [Sphingomonas sp. So64.6b]|uniref:hypothetical protein n=1 Tax=Sphingomonas sp. So64.6b TaxID=2997354 RepID=UPI001604054C|nr:hypothetical protein [Sphingomonas sp. So64.6b]QNA86405.1 hypothetical protein G4G27_22290 [Sphingomonas sp. So64.6b]
MTRTPGRVHSFSVEGVAKNFRFDWQFLIAASRINSALSLATLFSLIAIVTKFADLVNLGTPALICFIFASAGYALAIVIIKTRAPQILQEYPDYKSYEDKKHSHRWILWQFYHGVQTLENGAKLLQETIEKKLSYDVATLSRSRLPLNASFGGTCIARRVIITQRDGSTPTYDMCVHAPHNFDRDLIMGFTIKSSTDGVERKYVLPIREGDPKIDLKIKELFWITLTEAAKENPVSRWIAWTLVRASGLLLVIAVILAVGHTLLTPKPITPNPCCFHYLVGTFVRVAANS